MRLVKPNEPVPAKRGPARRAKPQWLKDYIADQGRWAEFSCKHRANINLQGTLIIAAFGKRHVSVYCERCNDFRSIVRYMKFNEYANIEVTAIPEIPLF